MSQPERPAPSAAGAGAESGAAAALSATARSIASAGAPGGAGGAGAASGRASFMPGEAAPQALARRASEAVRAQPKPGSPWRMIERKRRSKRRLTPAVHWLAFSVTPDLGSRYGAS